MTALTDTLQAELSTVVPEITSAAGTVLGALAPPALMIAGMVAVVGLTIGIFRRLMRG